MEDVYVFAFYTDDITTISGGPCSINGLPGMILGLTITTTIYLICSYQSRCVC
jgi:GLPGLI family protein